MIKEKKKDEIPITYDRNSMFDLSSFTDRHIRLPILIIILGILVIHWKIRIL